MKTTIAMVVCLGLLAGGIRGAEPETEMEEEARLSPGASEVEVRNVMGEPTRATNVIDGVVWYYDTTQIKFANGRMIQWIPGGRLVPVFMGDRKADAPPIVMGSDTNTVLDAMGSPSGLSSMEPLHQQIWHYGVSSIVIVDGRVKSWIDAWNLRVSPKIEKEAAVDTRLVETNKPDADSALPTSTPRIVGLIPGTPKPVQPKALATTPNPSVKQPPNAAPSNGRIHVKGYTRKDGTYVAPHYRNRK